MKLSEIRGKGEKELAKMIDEKKVELFGLRLQFSRGQLAKTATLKLLRKDIAQIFTVLKEKEMNRDGTTKRA